MQYNTIEIINKLLASSDIYGEDKIVNSPWIESPAEEVYIETTNFKMWDPGTHIRHIWILKN
jgi:hypothetical protein